MTKSIRWLSITLFILALVAVACMWFSDALRHLHTMSSHQQIGALPLILIGLSYIAFQFVGKRRLAERVKGLFLGFAFVLWGSEQLLPPSPWVMVMDSLVISIFVVDLALIIMEHLKRKDEELL
jgi:hypothetical protein